MKGVIVIGKGKVYHSKHVKDNLQTDKLAIKIPFDLLSDKGLEILRYWIVEDFYYGKIDWVNQEIVCVYQTEHYLPKNYVG